MFTFNHWYILFVGNKIIKEGGGGSGGGGDTLHMACICFAFKNFKKKKKNTIIQLQAIVIP